MVGEISFLILYEALYYSILGVEVVVIHMQSWNWRTIGFSYGKGLLATWFFFSKKKKIPMHIANTVIIKRNRMSGRM